MHISFKVGGGKGMNDKLEESIQNFVESHDYNRAIYYMILGRDINYYTLLKVESIDYVSNIADFIREHIGKVESLIDNGDRFDFVVQGETYNMFNYDGGLVKV
jgi:hypothetical protein